MIRAIVLEDSPLSHRAVPTIHICSRLERSPLHRQQQMMFRISECLKSEWLKIRIGFWRNGTVVLCENAWHCAHTSQSYLLRTYVPGFSTSVLKPGGCYM